MRCFRFLKIELFSFMMVFFVRNIDFREERFWSMRVVMFFVRAFFDKFSFRRFCRSWRVVVVFL